MPVKAILMDRDGTVIKEKPGTYLCDPKGVKLYKNTLEAFEIFKKLGYKLFIVSNQSGIGRGYFTEKEVKAVNAQMEKLLKPAATLDGIYYCPHAPSQPCNCRKPLPQMGLDIIKEHNVDPKLSFMIGDKKSDVDFGKTLGMRSILVLTANGRKQQKKYKDTLTADKISSDILGAAKYIRKAGQ